MIKEDEFKGTKAVVYQLVRDKLFKLEGWVSFERPKVTSTSQRRESFIFKKGDYQGPGYAEEILVPKMTGQVKNNVCWFYATDIDADKKAKKALLKAIEEKRQGLMTQLDICKKQKNIVRLTKFEEV